MRPDRSSFVRVLGYVLLSFLIFSMVGCVSGAGAQGQSGGASSGPARCLSCNGSGRCNTCGGTGRFLGSGESRCCTCSGSGRCINCR